MKFDLSIDQFASAVLCNQLDEECSIYKRGKDDYSKFSSGVYKKKKLLIFLIVPSTLSNNS